MPPITRPNSEECEHCSCWTSGGYCCSCSVGGGILTRDRGEDLEPWFVDPPDPPDENTEGFEVNLTWARELASNSNDNDDGSSEVED